MRKPTFAIGSLVLVLGALASVVVAQPRPRPVVRPVRGDASVATDAAATSDAATPSPDATVADGAGPAAAASKAASPRDGEEPAP